MVEGNPHIISEISESNFSEIALQIFQLQYQHNKVYHSFCDLLGKHPSQVLKIDEIPFLPVSFFKSQDLIVSGRKPEIIFSSSSTTGTGQSFHPMASLQLYEYSFLKSFELFYGPVKNYCVLALLPNYIERGGSSLVYMANKLIEISDNDDSGFYIDDFDKLSKTIDRCEASGKPTILLGVTYALLDFAEQFPKKLQHTIVMETGGMKGRRQELQKAELHEFLSVQLGVSEIHSEYGMTELLSQAYSKKNGIFTSPPWMKVLIRSVDDPTQILESDRWGAVNIIDLANIYSCSFLATDDVGKVYPNGTFELGGRLDYSDMRGCSLLYI